MTFLFFSYWSLLTTDCEQSMSCFAQQFSLIHLDCNVTWISTMHNVKWNSCFSKNNDQYEYAKLIDNLSNIEKIEISGVKIPEMK